MQNGADITLNKAEKFESAIANREAFREGAARGPGMVEVSESGSVHLW